MDVCVYCAGSENTFCGVLFTCGSHEIQVCIFKVEQVLYDVFVSTQSIHTCDVRKSSYHVC